MKENIYTPRVAVRIVIGAKTMLKSINYADVTPAGAILLGEDVVADGYHKRLIRVVTHAHQDHIKGLSKSFRDSLFVIATDLTFQFLKILGKRLIHSKILALPYNSPVEINGETITLVPARHIPGSAQVIVEGKEYRVGYTGDFKLPGTEPLKDLDILVIDATYGSPRIQRRWKDWEALSHLINLINEEIENGPVWIYGYNGKLQEVIIELRLRGIDYFFYADHKTFKLAQLSAEYYGLNIENLYPLTLDNIDPYSVIFISMGRKRNYLNLPGVHVTLTGWELRAPVVKTGFNSYNVSYSDHATFKEIIQYVEESKPKYVIVDGHRGTDAWYTAKYIERILGIPAAVRP